MSSEECAFGFRVACATLTIGIVAFLKDTQVFFQQQRLVWAMIIVAIGMSMTSGEVRVVRPVLQFSCQDFDPCYWSWVSDDEYLDCAFDWNFC